MAGIQVQWDSSWYRLKSASFEDAFDSLVLSTPASAAAEIVDPVSSEAAQVLRQIPYFSTVIVYLAYKGEEFAHPLDGHGFVVPRKEATVIDACTWVSSKFEGLFERAACFSHLRRRHPRVEYSQCSSSRLPDRTKVWEPVERHAQDFKAAFFLLPTCFSHSTARDVLSHPRRRRA